MTDDWTCRYCGRAFPVPSLTTEHETTCPHRPAETR